jgi:hypothetical protein
VNGPLGMAASAMCFAELQCVCVSCSLLLLIERLSKRCVLNVLVPRFRLRTVPPSGAPIELPFGCKGQNSMSLNDERKMDAKRG